MSARKRARRVVRRVQHKAHLARPSVYEVLAVNDDFTDRVTDIPALARQHKPLGIGGQETKGINYRTRLDQNTWGVRQRMATQATQGVMVAWNRELCHAVGSATDDPYTLGGGWIPIVEPRRGDDMLTRGVVWQDIQIRGTGIRIRLASYHRPPARHRDLWREADDRLEAWLDSSPIPVLLLTDANEPGGPNVDDHRWGWRGIGIDGAVSNLRVPSVYELAPRKSDHRPISVAVRPGIPRARR